MAATVTVKFDNLPAFLTKTHTTAYTILKVSLDFLLIQVVLQTGIVESAEIASIRCVVVDFATELTYSEIVRVNPIGLGSDGKWFNRQ